MSLTFINPVVFVKDINVSKPFYTDVLGLKIVADHGAFVLFEDHFSLHQAHELAQTVWGENIPAGTHQLQGRDNLLLYFETDELEQMFARIKDQVRLIHPIQKQTWGQLVFRFYDPDGHVVEIGEPL
jgi:catechol 2,3-dioxygenase-like lactoylglutathione lyase family enzyme